MTRRDHRALSDAAKAAILEAVRIRETLINKRLAAAHNASVSAVTHWITAARRKGLLHPGKPRGNPHERD